jgi:hypothetical protein
MNSHAWLRSASGSADFSSNTRIRPGMHAHIAAFQAEEIAAIEAVLPHEFQNARVDQRTQRLQSVVNQTMPVQLIAMQEPDRTSATLEA